MNTQSVHATKQISFDTTIGRFIAELSGNNITLTTPQLTDVIALNSKTTGLTVNYTGLISIMSFSVLKGSDGYSELMNFYNVMRQAFIGQGAVPNIITASWLEIDLEGFPIINHRLQNATIIKAPDSQGSPVDTSDITNHIATFEIKGSYVV